MDAQLKHDLAALEAEHRQLDERIAAMRTQEMSLNQMELARLRKRKLMLKDQIAMLRDQAIPDIIA